MLPYCLMSIHFLCSWCMRYCTCSNKKQLRVELSTCTKPIIQAIFFGACLIIEKGNFCLVVWVTVLKVLSEISYFAIVWHLQRAREMLMSWCSVVLDPRRISLLSIKSSLYSREGSNRNKTKDCTLCYSNLAFYCCWQHLSCRKRSMNMLLEFWGGFWKGFWKQSPWSFYPRQQTPQKTVGINTAAWLSLRQKMMWLHWPNFGIRAFRV